MSSFQFDARPIPPDPGRVGPVAAGWYNVILEKSEKKPTTDGLGEYLGCQFDIIDGLNKGRKIFHNFNLKNANAKAMEIGYQQLSAMMHAINVLVVQQDSSEMHNRPMKIRVGVREAEGKYDAQNEIKAFRNINEQVEELGRPVAPAGGMPAVAAPPIPPAQAWGQLPVAPPQQAPAPTQWAQPPAQPPMPPQQPPVQQQPPAQWQPPPQQQAPAQPPQAPQQWQQPPAAAPQPWAQAPAPAPAPMAPPPGAQPWAAPGGAQQPPAQVPPWMTQG